MSIAPTPYYTDNHVTLWHGDCLDVLRGLPDASVDAVVTDTPYNLGFMGQAWDRPGSAARGYRSDQELATNPYGRARVIEARIARRTNAARALELADEDLGLFGLLDDTEDGAA